MNRVQEAFNALEANGWNWEAPEIVDMGLSDSEVEQVKAMKDGGSSSEENSAGMSDEGDTGSDMGGDSDADAGMAA